MALAIESEPTVADRRRSLRASLAMATGLGVGLLTLAAGLVVATTLWIAETNLIGVDAEVLLFDQFEHLQRAGGDVSPAPMDTGMFAIALDESDEVASSGVVEPEVADLIITESIIDPFLDEFLIAVHQIAIDDTEWAVAYTACPSQSDCTTLGVGVSASSWTGFVAARLVWLVGAAIVVGLLAAAGAGLLVGRSLHPVEAMRQELADTTATDLSRRVPVIRTGDELEALGTTLNETLARLESAVTANQRFVADAAHELRSPLAGIRAAVELRAGTGKDDLLTQTLEEIDRASALVDDLLLLASQETPKGRIETLDLAEIVTDEVSALRVREPGVDVSVEANPALVSGDRAELGRSIRNLLDNAAQHGNGTVAVFVGDVGDRAMVTIDDNGPGIPTSQREQIFERFVRLDESRTRSAGGSGLGLAIARELTERHGGTITVDDSPLGGARFVMVLPAIAAA